MELDSALRLEVCVNESPVGLEDSDGAGAVIYKVSAIRRRGRTV